MKCAWEMDAKQKNTPIVEHASECELSSLSESGERVRCRA